MQKDVTQGKSYCLTVYSVPCKVTAIGENNIEYTLLNVWTIFVYCSYLES